MERSVSVKDIAQKLNISLSTVHKALTGKPGISEERRKEVLKTAEELGYRVNSVAQILARKEFCIAIFMPRAFGEYFGAMKEGIEKELLHLAKYKVKGVFYEIKERTSEEEVLSFLAKHTPDAIIYCPSIYSLDRIFSSAFTKANLPVFLAGASEKELESVTDVVIDGARSGRLAADFLRAARPEGVLAAVLTGTRKLSAHSEKVEAFRARVEAFGGCVAGVFETEDDPEKTYKAMQKIFASGGVNSIYVTTATSVPVCRYIEEHGLLGRITLICTDLFDELKDYMKKNIVSATLYQNQEKIGALSVRAAYDYLVSENSYMQDKGEITPLISVRPNLYLLADIE